MKRLEVHYYLSRSSVEFQCPCCRSTQGETGCQVQLINGHLIPEPGDVVAHHLILCGEVPDGYSVISPGDGGFEIEAVIHDPAAPA